MRVFITGIAGFLGSNLAHALLREGHQVSGNDTLIGGYIDNVPEEADFHHVDCRYLNAMERLTADHDVVVHAACTAYEGLSVFSPHLVTQNTFQISSTVFTACAASNVRRVINCSSMARYGTQEVMPYTETMRPKPQDPYGIAKVAAEDLLRILSEVHGFEMVNLVPHNIIGPRQKYDDPFRNVASIMINRMLRGQQPIIYGDGQQTRCFSDVRDVVPCFMEAITRDDVVGETINVGPDEEVITINELAAAIAEVLAFDGFAPIHVDPRPQEVRHAFCSSDKARSLLDYQTRHTLVDSLAHLADWIRTRGSRRFRYHLNVEIPSDQCPRTWTDRLL